MAKRKGGLGRGLDALFADAAPLFEEDLEQNEEEDIGIISAVMVMCTASVNQSAATKSKRAIPLLASVL